MIKYEYKIINSVKNKEGENNFNWDMPSEWKFVGTIGNSIILERVITDDTFPLDKIIGVGK